MNDKLSNFINKYSDVMTVNMLFDLCNAVGIEPSKLLADNKCSPNNFKLKAPLQERIEKNKIIRESIKAQEVTTPNLPLNNYTAEKFNDNKYLTCIEVAERLQIKKTTVYEWIKSGQLNAMRLGRDYRIRIEDLKTFEKARFTKKD